MEHEVRSAEQSLMTSSRRFLLTRDEYYEVALTGLFEGRRVELIEGELIQMMPIDDYHAAITDPLARVLHRTFGEEYAIRTQVPIALGDNYRPSDPQPDATVAIGSWRDYTARKPVASDIRLLVEVSDSSLTFDRTIKAALYGDAGIPEYWIVNLNDRQIEVHRQPKEGGYDSLTTYGTGDAIEPLFAEGRTVKVSEILGLAG
jgi:Uma2 family endonuclease